MLRPWTIVISNCRSVDSSSLHQSTAPFSSCMLIQKSQVPAWVGVPEIKPLDDKNRPGGRALFSNRNETYGVQPVPSRPFSWYEYGLPVSPWGQTLITVPVFT